MTEKSIIELDDMNWELLVEKEGKPMVVMFYSPTCPHCLAMMPHFERYADEFKGKISFARIDITRNPFSVSRYGVMATPTFSSSAPDARYKRSWARYILLCSRRLQKMHWSMEAHVHRDPRQSILI